MATRRLTGDLGAAIANQDDPATVEAGAPAYLLLADGLIQGSPGNVDLLLTGARMYAAYAAVFVDDPQRVHTLSDRALDYARRAMCARRAVVCAHDRAPFEAFVPVLTQLGPADVPVLYTYASTWAGWIQAHSDDLQAVAALPKVEAMMERVVALDPEHDHGRPYLYLGVMRSYLPPAMGGRPEAGKAAFERAIAISGGQDLMAKVEYAARYARMVFDRALHDRLVTEVLQADPRVEGLTLSNVLAQRRAEDLRASADEYF
jgi:hypothetical protein